MQYIELDGIVKKTKTFDKAGNENLDSSKICVYNESKKLVAVFYTNKKGKCKFRLPLNKKFTIEIGKKGFVSKLIEVNTKVPPERKIGYGFPFEISIFEELKELDTSILQKPIAKISFSMSQNQFAYDYMNTDYINNELRRQYKEYYFLREVDADFKKDSLDTQNKK
ncbi:MAG: hypothetical protein J0M08_06650 [Bacteroidetes bacterium]|nr:hypothetical protein [Bacteroidota bacterium]